MLSEGLSDEIIIGQLKTWLTQRESEFKMCKPDHQTRINYSPTVRYFVSKTYTLSKNSNVTKCISPAKANGIV
jgi:hypothetical protein